MKQKIIGLGAEAKIYLKKNKVTKKRISKSYRLPQLDEQIRKLRTRAEGKILEKAGRIISTPNVLKTNEKNKEILMEFINGKKLSEYLNKFPLTKQKEICMEIGKNTAKLHSIGIIHGDLTTSNMIYVKDKKKLNIPENFQNLLNELKKLKLRTEDYTVLGGGTLAIRGIRDTKDIDIVVTISLWNKLIKKYSKKIYETNQGNIELIKIGHLEIGKTTSPQLVNSKKLIDNSDIINGIRFIKLDHLLKWKRVWNRQKDQEDIKLINEFIENKKLIDKTRSKTSKRGDNSSSGGGMEMSSSKNFRVFFIDFGLSFHSHKYEDKAVDIHLIKQALEAKHFKNWQTLYTAFLDGYSKESKEEKLVLKQLEKVEKRGRYRH